eukprot:4221704-Lingulodinium_polyedra.AAC.1
MGCGLSCTRSTSKFRGISTSSMTGTSRGFVACAGAGKWTPSMAARSAPRGPQSGMCLGARRRSGTGSGPSDFQASPVPTWRLAGEVP